VAVTDDPRRSLPGVDTLLAHPALAELSSSVSSDILVALIREVLDDVRDHIAKIKTAPSLHEIAARVRDRVEDLRRPSPRRAVNATGVILHTGLGRAPLGDDAIHAVESAARYCNLEFDLATGDRGERQDHIEALLRYLTGAEAALVVNNNAAALYLVLNALGYHREVIVSRGQLIEIGGSFRLPDIMARSGVRLVEVGTTNRTRIGDYRAAITPKTALLLSAHPSNYRITGFTESVAIEDLCALGRENNIPVVDDIGNGLLWDWTHLGLPAEPNIAASLKAGTDLALVSGDKALGGPQAGIILGKRDLVKRLRKNPLARVVRADKMALSALNATLRCYLDRRTLFQQVPFWAMLTAPLDVLRARAGRLRDRLVSLGPWQTLEVRETSSEAGSGTLPAIALPSIGISCLPQGRTAAAWAKSLRCASIPVVGTVRQDLLWLDMRTVAEPEVDIVVEMVSQALLER
jgi:L-seryl-tRNA(Ser) seleniumtransferase